MALYGDEEELVVGVSPFLKDWVFYNRIVKAFSVASFDLIGPALSQRLIAAVNSVSFFLRLYPVKCDVIFCMKYVTAVTYVHPLGTVQCNCFAGLSL